ncbi:MAG: DUF1917 domain-containing protein [Candidatus Thermoplasmatota archaeon]|nr:DUF1917 domain-containing protein [Candidatus Thermoplasmatota archaeon]
MSEEDRYPSEVKGEGKDWLLCGLKRSGDRLEEYLEINDVSHPEKIKEDELPEEEEPKVKKIDKRAIDDEYLSGKWELTVSPEEVDDVWENIKRLISEGKIWGGQVTTRWIREKRDMDEHRIRVYTPNYLDEEDVLRVGNLLKDECSIEEQISYKPDIYNILQVYSEEGEDMKLPKEIRYTV